MYKGKVSKPLTLLQFLSPPLLTHPPACDPCNPLYLTTFVKYISLSTLTHISIHMYTCFLLYTYVCSNTHKHTIRSIWRTMKNAQFATHSFSQNSSAQHSSSSCQLHPNPSKQVSDMDCNGRIWPYRHKFCATIPLKLALCRIYHENDTAVVSGKIPSIHKRSELDDQQQSSPTLFGLPNHSHSNADVHICVHWYTATH